VGKLKISLQINVSSYMNSVLLSEYVIFSYLFNKKFVSYKLRLKIQYVAPPLHFPYF